MAPEQLNTIRRLYLDTGHPQTSTGPAQRAIVPAANTQQILHTSFLLLGDVWRVFVFKCGHSPG